MSGNSFGNLFKITTFGESHGNALGLIIDGFPSNIAIDFDLINQDLQRRKPGQSKITTQRKENEEFEILSGIFENKSTGTPISVIVKNTDQRSHDYSHISETFRPSHADYTYQEKYQLRDYRGGGRSSARETVARVIGGSFAKMYLDKFNIKINAYVSKVGNLELEKSYNQYNLDLAENNIVRCPDPDMAEAMIELIDNIRKEGDTIGGIVSCVIQNVPVGIGEPVFDKLHAELGKAMLSINAVKGFEYGSGFSSVNLKGSQHNDAFYNDNGKVKTKTNFSGGIQGGISNGEDIYFNVAFKPVATIMQTQETIDIHGNQTEVKGRGRHDPCVVPRAVPIVEAMAALVIADYILISKAYK
ncbi:chorismate synthase [bacterium]|nr:MAG: chorismate synthase [bacterium]